MNEDINKQIEINDNEEMEIDGPNKGSKAKKNH